jgi:hypothetical protein
MTVVNFDLEVEKDKSPVAVNQDVIFN